MSKEDNILDELLHLHRVHMKMMGNSRSVGALPRRMQKETLERIARMDELRKRILKAIKEEGA